MVVVGGVAVGGVAGSVGGVAGPVGWVAGTGGGGPPTPGGATVPAGSMLNFSIGIQESYKHPHLHLACRSACKDSDAVISI